MNQPIESSARLFMVFDCWKITPPASSYAARRSTGIRRWRRSVTAATIARLQAAPFDRALRSKSHITTSPEPSSRRQSVQIKKAASYWKLG